MRISKHEEIGLRLVASLARKGGQLTTRELADTEGLPETTVAKVVARLRTAGLVEAERGRNGGYSLTGSAHDITLAEVVGAFDAHVFDSDFCTRMNAGAGCAHDADCGLRPLWRGLGDLIGSFLGGFTVADLVQGPSATHRAHETHGRLPVIPGAAG
jgi:Rrf2 family nitric oxide-sensitive transcriptional repressor